MQSQFSKLEAFSSRALLSSHVCISIFFFSFSFAEHFWNVRILKITFTGVRMLPKLLCVVEILNKEAREPERSAGIISYLTICCIVPYADLLQSACIINRFYFDIKSKQCGYKNPALLKPYLFQRA